MRNINYLRTLIIVVLGLFMTSCESPEYKMCPSYVAQYRGIEEIRLETNDLGIDIRGNMNYIDCNFNSSGEKGEVFSELCKKHNDLSYNQKVMYMPVLRGPTYINKDYVSVTVTSNKDFDAEHPAGASLATKVRFMSFSPYKFINSQYKDTYLYDKSGDGLSKSYKELVLPKYPRDLKYSDSEIKKNKFAHHPIDKMLSDLKKEDLILLGTGSYDGTLDDPEFLGTIVFEELPLEKGTHNITVTLETDDGILFSAQISKVF